MKRTIFMMAVAVLLAGCQATLVRYENTGPQRLATGSYLVLQKPIVMPAGASSVDIQGGKIISWWSIDQYEFFCTLELRRPAREAITLRPGRFRIVRIDAYEDWISQHSPTYAPRVILAGGDDVVENRIDYYLVSRTQPMVEKISCGRWGYADEIRAPNVREIRQTLGDWFVFQD